MNLTSFSSGQIGIIAIAIAIAIAAASPAFAQEADLAKQLSNPIASLISVPFQVNYDRGYGPDDGHRVMLNIQPVIPISLNEDWNLISRTILPVIFAKRHCRALGRSVRPRRYRAEIFLLPQGADGRRDHLGRRPGLSDPDGNGRSARQRKMGHRPDRRRFGLGRAPRRDVPVPEMKSVRGRAFGSASRGVPLCVSAIQVPQNKA